MINRNTKLIKNFLKNKKFWIHAKNIECFYELHESNLNYFWHENDKVILTSKGFFWNFSVTKPKEIIWAGCMLICKFTLMI